MQTLRSSCLFQPIVQRIARRPALQKRLPGVSSARCIGWTRFLKYAHHDGVSFASVAVRLFVRWKLCPAESVAASLR